MKYWILFWISRYLFMMYFHDVFYYFSIRYFTTQKPNYSRRFWLIFNMFFHDAFGWYSRYVFMTLLIWFHDAFGWYSRYTFTTLVVFLSRRFWFLSIRAFTTLKILLVTTLLVFFTTRFHDPKNFACHDAFGSVSIRTFTTLKIFLVTTLLVHFHDALSRRYKFCLSRRFWFFSRRFWLFSRRIRFFSRHIITTLMVLHDAFSIFKMLHSSGLKMTKSVVKTPQCRTRVCTDFTKSVLKKPKASWK